MPQTPGLPAGRAGTWPAPIETSRPRASPSTAVAARSTPATPASARRATAGASAATSLRTPPRPRHRFRVGLGQPPRGPGKVPDLLRIGDHHRQPRRCQGRHRRRLIASGGLQDDHRGLQRPEARHEALNRPRGVGHLPLIPPPATPPPAASPSRRRFRHWSSLLPPRQHAPFLAYAGSGPGQPFGTLAVVRHDEAQATARPLGLKAVRALVVRLREDTRP